MRRFRKSLTAVAAAVAITVTTIVVQADVGSAQPASPDHDIEYLDTQVPLVAGGTWISTPLTVTLPWPGQYALDADVRVGLQGTPPVNTYITARLWNDTANTAVPQSERLVHQVTDLNAGAAAAGDNRTAPISELIRVTGPTTIRLQARRIDAIGSATTSQLYSDAIGYTSLRYERLSP
jgi:hypothetical protein